MHQGAIVAEVRALRFAYEQLPLPSLRSGYWRRPAPCELDIWLWDVETLDSEHDELDACLSKLERARRDRFLQEKDRRRFTRCRGLLRHVLAGYLGPAPDQLEIGQMVHGKPFLAGQSGSDQLQFNLSHTGTWMALACSCRDPVGIDIELHDREVSHLELAARFFHHEELVRLSHEPSAGQPRLFYHWWTAKEALLKARGTGLMDHLDQINLSRWPATGPAEIVEADGTRRRAGGVDGPEILTGVWVGGPDIATIRLRSATASD